MNDKPHRRKFDVIVLFRCTEEQKEMLGEIAERRQVDASQALRDLIMEETKREARRERQAS